MSDKKLSDVSTKELLTELLSRKSSSIGLLDSVDFDSFEEGLESLGEELKHEVVESWFEEQSRSPTSPLSPCPRCGKDSKLRAKGRKRTLHALHGTFSYSRNYHYCDSCSFGFYPKDQDLGLPNDGESTKALSRRILDFALNAPYSEASERFELHYGRPVSTHFMQCVVGRMPLPDFSELKTPKGENRVTVQIDGSHVPMRSGWKEAKVGVVFSDDHHSPKDGSTRGVISEANYVATMGAVDDFAAHLKQIIPKRTTRKERLHGKQTMAKEVVWVADGAPWIWNLQKKLNPQAIGILDIAHALEHAMSCGKELLEEDLGLFVLWKRRVDYLIRRGLVEALIEELKDIRVLVDTLPKRKTINALIRYYENHKHRMDYPTHQRAGRMIGSGVVESAHKHVLQTRMKKAGCHWSVKGAEKMARLRAVYRSVGPKTFFDKVHKMAV
jgi:hypothetical protein